MTPTTYGFAVFPCHSIGADGQCTCGKGPACNSPGKHPRTANGVKDATRDRAQIEKWAAQWPGAINWAAATGKVAGVFVVDVDIADGKPGEQSLEDWIVESGELPETFTVRTGSGGTHLYFAYPDDGIRGRNPWLPGVDVKSDGGYVLLPGSRHKSGGTYEPVTSAEVRIAKAPEALLAAIGGGSGRSTSDALRDTRNTLDGLAEGERDDVLFRWACRLRRQHASDDDGGRAVVETLVLEAARNAVPAFPEDQALAKVEQAFKQDHSDVARAADPNDPASNADAWLSSRDPDRRLISQGGVFFEWNGACYVEVEDRALRSALWTYFKDATYFDGTGSPKRWRPNTSRIANVVEGLHASTHVPHDLAAPAWLDGDGPFPAAEAVPCGNGVLHVPTRKLYAASPNLLVHHSTPFDFDPAAATPSRWVGFLDEIFGGDQQAAETLQDWFGYILSGDKTLEKAVLMVGPSRSGKGTVAKILTELIGSRHVAGPTLSSLATNFGLQPLIGKPLAIVADARLQANQTTVLERMLSISSRDLLTIDRKNTEPWSGVLPTRLMLMTNELPRLRDASGAMASRFVVLHTPVSFLGREDPDLFDNLQQELPGIFNWALDGLDRVRQRRKLLTPPSSEMLVHELEDLTSPVSAFVRDRCVLDPNAHVERDKLFGAWTQWSVAHGIRTGGVSEFGRDLRAAVPQLRDSKIPLTDGKRRNGYGGITLVDDGYMF